MNKSQCKIYFTDNEVLDVIIWTLLSYDKVIKGRLAFQVYKGDNCHKFLSVGHWEDLKTQDGPQSQHFTFWAIFRKIETVLNFKWHSEKMMWNGEYFLWGLKFQIWKLCWVLLSLCSMASLFMKGFPNLSFFPIPFSELAKIYTETWSSWKSVTSLTLILLLFPLSW